MRGKKCMHSIVSLGNQVWKPGFVAILKESIFMFNKLTYIA